MARPARAIRRPRDASAGWVDAFTTPCPIRSPATHAPRSIRSRGRWPMGGTGGHPPGLGPVFAFEWLAASRRWQGYAVRSLFVLLSLAALVVIWTSRSEFRGAT